MGRTNRRWRLAICLSHPIHYRVPLLQRLAAHPEIDKLKVLFYSNTGLVSRPDAYHGVAAKWDVPLLDGYESELLADRRLRKTKSGGYLNPSVVSRLLDAHWDAVMITSYLYPSDWLAWTVARLTGMHVLFYGEMYTRASAQSLLGRLKGLPKKLMLGRGTACLATGAVAAQAYRDLGIADDRIFLAPYAVDNKFFTAGAAYWQPRKSQIKAELGIPDTTPVVLCVAGMVPKKRQVDLIEAMTRLTTRARLVLVGQGPLQEDVRAACRRLLPDTILAGFKNQTELPRYYAIADVFVLPSLWEEFGLVINEAMCFGLPIIASEKVAAVRDLVRVGENGFTFTPTDVAALGAHLETLLRDEDMRRRFGARSREIIAAWSYDQAVQGILAALESSGRRSGMTRPEEMGQ